jgi:DNA-binding NarL/FixJ family response regulator
MRRRRRLVIATAEPLLARGIAAVLEEANEFEPVGEASSPDDVLGLVVELEPDVLLLDAPLAVQRESTVRCLKQRVPDLAVVVLGPATERMLISAAFDEGAAGYLVRDIAPEQLSQALADIASARRFKVVGAPSGWRERTGVLTRRELEVLECAAQGLSNRQIADRFWLSEQTVKFHLANAFRKLGVSNRTEAGRAAYRLNLLSAPGE